MLDRISRSGAMRVQLAAGAVLLSGVLVMLVGAGQGGSASTMVTSTQITGGTPQQQGLLREVIARLPRSQLSALSITTPPEDFEPPDASWLAIDVAATSPAEDVRGFWQALLVAGTFRDASAARGLPYVAGKSITVRGPDGSVMDEGSSLIDQPLGHAIETTSDIGLVGVLQAAAGRAGVTYNRASFAHLLGRSAVEVLVTTQDPVGFVRNRPIKLSQLVGGLENEASPQAEGAYVEVRDTLGRLVTLSAYSIRTGEGLGYTNPDLQGAAQSAFGTILR
jgi:hypothetical protein